MEYGIISCLPIAILIIGVIITKKMPEMLLLSSLVGAIIIYGTGFLSGYVEMLYMALSNEAYQLIFFILIGFGGMIKVFEKSGALLGFSNILSKYANTPKKSLVLTWLLGGIIFIDDYLNALAVASSMRSLTDKQGIPREHLAYTVNAMGTCVCVLIPFTSWSGFGIGITSEFGMSFSDYVSAIPFMFYPIATVVICLLLALGIFPRIGNMKIAYNRVEETGETIIVEEEGGASIFNIEKDETVKPVSPLNFLIPIIALVVGMIIFDNDLIHGIIVALVVQAVMYIVQKIMTPTEYMSNLFDGITSMATLMFIILIAFVLSSGNEMMGFSEYVIDVFTKSVSPALLPAIAFFIVGFIAFTAASFWVLIALTVPIFIPLSLSMGVNPVIVLAAIMSGVALGSQSCFYSDAVFMTAAGTEVSNVTQVKAIAPYVIIGAAISFVLYLIAGFMM